MANAYVETVERLRALLSENEEDGDMYLVDSAENEEDGDVYLDDSVHLSDVDFDSDYEIDHDYDESHSISDVYVGSDKTIWMKQKLQSLPEDGTLTSDLSIPGPKGNAENVTDPLSSWKLFFDDALINQIVEYTNIRFDKASSNFTRERDGRKTDIKEINALIGLLYLGGLFKSSHKNPADLWSSDGTGISIFHATMACKRFHALLSKLCFDDSNTRQDRETVDNFAPMRDLFEKFNMKCQEVYSMGKYVTIDNILVPYGGKCKFKKMKELNCGIVIFMLVDAGTLYTYNMEVFNKSQPEGQYKVSNTPDNIVKRLMKPLFKSGSKNLTIGSWLTSYALAKELLAEDITVVGEMRKSRKELPPQFKSSCERPTYSSVFGFRDDATIVAYSSERGECIRLLSTMHKDDLVDESNAKRIPEVLRFYNSTKEAVNTLNEILTSCSTNRMTRAWPLVVFFHLLNVAATNARILLMSTKDPPLKYVSKRLFLKELGLALVKDHMKHRSSVETLPRILRSEIAKISDENPEQQEGPLPKKMKIPTKGRCYICPRKKDKKTRSVCQFCLRLTCHDHYRVICHSCADGFVQG